MIGVLGRVDTRNRAYLIVVIQPNPLQRDDLVCVPVLGLEHGAICTWGVSQSVSQRSLVVAVRQYKSLRHRIQSNEINPTNGNNYSRFQVWHLDAFIGISALRKEVPTAEILNE